MKLLITCIKSTHFKTDKTFSDCEAGEILADLDLIVLPKPWTLPCLLISWIDFPFHSTAVHEKNSNSNNRQRI